MTDDIILLIRFLYFALDREKNLYFEQHNLTASQVDVLFFVAGSKIHNKEVNQRDIETHLHLTNPTVTGILKRLEEKVFISRVKSEADGRNKLIQLTTQSEALLDQFMQYKNKIESMFLSDMNEEDITQLRSLLKKALHNMQCNDKNKKGGY